MAGKNIYVLQIYTIYSIIMTSLSRQRTLVMGMNNVLTSAFISTSVIHGIT
jgi:acetylglutamate synthase